MTSAWCTAATTAPTSAAAQMTPSTGPTGNTAAASTTATATQGMIHDQRGIQAFSIDLYNYKARREWRCLIS
jgi:hypothetical protein